MRKANIISLIATVLIMFAISNALAEKMPKLVSLALNDVEISEAMEMLSIKERVNIVLAKDVTGKISINLYNVTIREAVLSIANAAGYAVELRGNSYFVLKREESGKYANSGLTELRTYKVKYSKSEDVEQILETYLSEYGNITSLTERNLLVIEDLPSFLDRIEKLIKEIDQQPQQIFIEAKILEVTLRESESYGLDWTKLFSSDGGSGSFGTRGLSNIFSPGLFFNLVTPNVEVALDLLLERGRLRTLSTPKLLALEDQEAEVIIGDRLGFRVTTTINQVTSETIEFLESGVIMRVTPAVDGQGRILLDIHPEVSTGRVEDGIPNQVTTEVTTQMLVDDGQTIFIGGLIRRSLDQNKSGVPVLGDIPVVGKAFSNTSVSSLNTETVVLITPYIVKNHSNYLNKSEQLRAKGMQKEFTKRASDIDKKFVNPSENSESVITEDYKPNQVNTIENLSVENAIKPTVCASYDPTVITNPNCSANF